LPVRRFLKGVIRIRRHRGMHRLLRRLLIEQKVGVAEKEIEGAADVVEAGDRVLFRQHFLHANLGATSSRMVFSLFGAVEAGAATRGPSSAGEQGNA